MRGQIQLKRKGQAEMVHVRPRTCFENARIRIYHVLGPMIFRHQTRSKHDVYMWVSILAMECVRKLPRGQVLVLQSQRSNLKCVHLMGEKHGILNLFFVVATQRFCSCSPRFFGGNETFPIWRLAPIFSKSFFCSTTQLYTSSIFLPPWVSLGVSRGIISSGGGCSTHVAFRHFSTTTFFPSGKNRGFSNTHRIHGIGIFKYMNGWFLW